MIEVDNDKEEMELDESEWKNMILRHSLAVSSIIKVNETKASTYLNKYVMSRLTSYLEENKINVVFVNSTLTFTQKRNMEKYFNDYLLDKLDRVRRYNLKSSEKEGDATDTHSEFSNISEASDFSDVESNLEISSKVSSTKIKVLDRFDVILFIFASKANSNISKFQLELAYLKSAKSKLNRGGSSAFKSYIKGLSGIIKSQFISETIDTTKEIVSGKQSSGKGSLGGSGEKQIELEKRMIATRENELKERIFKASEQKKKEILSRKENNPIPSVSLIGYTNSGKTAIMNLLAKSNLDSEDVLFQTLSTTIKKVDTNKKGSNSFFLMDTVGFISNLPLELVDSFKSTIEEMLYSDVILHVIDVSNPMHEYQSKVVYSILDDIYKKNGDVNLEYKKRVIEVWNKIDLLSSIDEIKKKIQVREEQDDQSKINDNNDNSRVIVPISALEKVNIKNLIKEIEIMINLIFNRKEYSIEVLYEDYNSIYEWLKNISSEPRKVGYSKNGTKVGFKVYFDEVQKDVFMKSFYNQGKAKIKECNN